MVIGRNGVIGFAAAVQGHVDLLVRILAKSIKNCTMDIP